MFYTKEKKKESLWDMYDSFYCYLYIYRLVLTLIIILIHIFKKKN